MIRVLIIVPAHNESKAIDGVVRSLKALGHDVLVVDDGSVDDTAVFAKQAGAEVISTDRKSGKGNALRMGFAQALNRNVDAVITVDGDGQHDPADILSFLHCAETTKAGIVNGNRLGNPKGMPLIRLLTNQFMSAVISGICRQKIVDSQCGFRLITKEVLANITLSCNDFEIETEMLVQASKKGFKIANVPIATIYRDEVSKIHPLKDTWRFVVYLWKELRRR